MSTRKEQKTPMVKTISIIGLIMGIALYILIFLSESKSESDKNYFFLSGLFIGINLIMLASVVPLLNKVAEKDKGIKELQDHIKSLTKPTQGTPSKNQK